MSSSDNCSECHATFYAHHKNFSGIRYPTVSRLDWHKLMDDDFLPDEGVSINYKICYFWKPAIYQYSIFDYLYDRA